MKKREFNLPLDYVFDTTVAFCWLLVPLLGGKWLAVSPSNYKERPCAYDESDKPLHYGWRLVVLQRIHNCTIEDKYGRRFKRLKDSLFGDEWYRKHRHII